VYAAGARRSQADQVAFGNSGRPLGEVVALEVFCGSGRLTASLKREGFDAFGVDHNVLKTASCSVLQLDLTQEDAASHLWSIVKDPAVQFIHFAPPCGTASRARDIQFKGAPPILRSTLQPQGVDGLEGLDATRVAKANLPYQLTLEVSQFCLKSGKFFSCENPSRSYLWLLPAWKTFLARQDVFQTSFHHCEYGGMRRKATLLVHNVPSFRGLQRFCSGNHVHLGWGRVGPSWATADEAAYPWGLCKSMASFLKDHFVSLGFAAPAADISGSFNQVQASRAFTGVQSRKREPPLISEFASVHTVTVPTQVADSFLRPGNKLPSDWRPGSAASCRPPLALFPAGSRVLRAHVLPKGWSECAQEGSLWMEDPDGEVEHEFRGRQVKGVCVPVTAAGFRFDGKRLHATMPWVGRRDVIVAYMSRGARALEAEHASFLTKLGFLLDRKKQPPPAGSTGVTKAVIGVYRTPEQFVAGAVKVGHPTQLSSLLPAEIRGAVRKIHRVGEANGVATCPGKTTDALFDPDLGIWRARCSWKFTTDAGAERLSHHEYWTVPGGVSWRKTTRPPWKKLVEELKKATEAEASMGNVGIEATEAKASIGNIFRDATLPGGERGDQRHDAEEDTETSADAGKEKHGTTAKKDPVTGDAGKAKRRSMAEKEPSSSSSSGGAAGVAGRSMAEEDPEPSAGDAGGDGDTVATKRLRRSDADGVAAWQDPQPSAGAAGKEKHQAIPEKDLGSSAGAADNEKHRAIAKKEPLSSAGAAGKEKHEETTSSVRATASLGDQRQDGEEVKDPEPELKVRRIPPGVVRSPGQILMEEVTERLEGPFYFEGQPVMELPDAFLNEVLAALGPRLWHGFARVSWHEVAAYVNFCMAQSTADWSNLGPSDKSIFIPQDPAQFLLEHPAWHEALEDYAVHLCGKEHARATRADMLRQLSTCSQRALAFIYEVCDSLPDFFGPVQEELLDVCVSLLESLEPDELEGDYAIKASPDARVKREKPARSPSPEAKRLRAAEPAESADSEEELLSALAKPPLPPPAAPPEPPEDSDSQEDTFNLAGMVPHAEMEADEAKPRRVIRKPRKKTKQQQKDELKEQCAAKVAALGIDHNRDFQARHRRARAAMPTGHWAKFQEALVPAEPEVQPLEKRKKGRPGRGERITTLLDYVQQCRSDIYTHRAGSVYFCRACSMEVSFYRTAYSAKVYMDKHEATQKHVKGLAAMHLPLPDAEQQHPECAGHNLDEGSCKLHPYKSSWLHWLSEGRPTLKPVEGREAENLMEVVVNEAASLTIRHSACDPAAGPLCKACSSLPKFANKEVCKWSYRLDLAQLAQLCVYQDRGTVLAALEEVETTWQVYQDNSFAGLLDHCQRAWICIPRSCLTKFVRSYMQRTIENLRVVDMEADDRVLHLQMLRSVSDKVQAGHVSELDVELGAWIAAGKLKEHRVVDALMKTFYDAQRRIERGHLARPGSRRHWDETTTSELMDTLGGGAKQNKQMLQLFYVKPDKAELRVPFEHPGLPDFFLTHVFECAEAGAAKILGLLRAHNTRLVYLAVDETYWKPDYQLVSGLGPLDFSVVGGGWGKDTSYAYLSADEERKEEHLARLSLSIVASRVDTDRVSYETNFIPLLPGKGGNRAATVMELVGTSMSSMSKANGGVPPLGCSYDGGKNNSLLNRTLLGLTPVPELNQYPFWRHVHIKPLNVVQMCPFGMLMYKQKADVEWPVLGCNDARHVLKRYTCHHFGGLRSIQHGSVAMDPLTMVGQGLPVSAATLKDEIVWRWRAERRSNLVKWMKHVDLATPQSCGCIHGGGESPKMKVSISAPPPPKTGGMVGMAADLEAAEEEFKRDMPKFRKDVLASKRLLLFRDLLREVGHEDDELVADIAKGFDLTGKLPRSNVFVRRFRPAEQTESQLRAGAKRLRDGLLATMKASDNPVVDDGVLKATQKELERGFVEGPLRPEDVPANASLTHRFGVLQGVTDDGPKVRPIDNYLSSQVNAAVTQVEQVSVHTIDVVAGMLGCWLHERFLAGQPSHSSPLCKAWDLRTAYKQLPLSDASFELDSYFVIFNGRTGSSEIYRQRVLPFGSTASVTSFIRAAYALWRLGTLGLDLVWSEYFDDYLSVCGREFARHCDFVISLFFQLLGWEVSKDKELSYDSMCTVLGVRINLEDAKLGLCFLGNTDKRRADAVAQITSALALNKLDPAECEKLRGRLQFASCQIFGRRPKAALKVLAQHGRQRKWELSEPTSLALGQLKHLLEEGTPLSWFEHKVDDQYITALRTEGSRAKETVIFELEALVLSICLDVFRPFVDRKGVVVFTDNEGVFGCFVRGHSDDIMYTPLIDFFAKCEDHLLEWYKCVHYDFSSQDHADSVDASRGLKQGRLVALLLWSLVTGRLLYRLALITDVQWVSQNVTAYADDFHAAATAHNQQDLQTAERYFNQFLGLLVQSGMVIASKSAILYQFKGGFAKRWLRQHVCQGPDGPLFRIRTDSGELVEFPVVDSHTYLGTKISYSDPQLQTLVYRVGLAKVEWSRLRKLVCSRHGGSSNRVVTAAPSKGSSRECSASKPRKMEAEQVWQIQATQAAFAAILLDGSVVTWGTSYLGATAALSKGSSSRMDPSRLGVTARAVVTAAPYRFWIVARDFGGNPLVPVRVCRTSLLSAVLQALPCRTVGEMEEEGEGIDGEKLSARDCTAVGEGFLDQLCPLCILPCGQDEEGAEVTVHCVVVGDIKGKLLICLPSASWHRTVARRTVPKGFLSRVFAAEVAAASLADRSAEVPGQILRVWLGSCEVEAENLLEVSDATPSVPFGALPSGELLVPSIDVLAEIWQAQQANPPTTPLHTASEGGGQAADVTERIASIERSVAALTAAFRDASLSPGLPAATNVGSKPKVAPAPPKTFLGSAAKQRGAEADFPGLDQGVIAAALAAGVQHGALAEMSKLVSAGPLARLKPEAPAAAIKQAAQTALEESEEEGQEAPLFSAQAAGSTDPQHADPAEMFAKAVVKCFDAYHGKTVAGKTALDKALEAGAGGSLDGSLSSGRRHATARRALREALTSAPQELSALIEGLMAEDLCASTPGAGAPVLTSTRAWLEHRSRIQAFPTMVNLVWAIGGALDCLRANKVDQARARLNIALMQADQVSIDRGSWLLAQELSLEVGPPMTSFKRHEAVSSHGDPVYSRLLDARWAEVAIAKLREEAEFMERRQKLGQRLQPNLKDESAGETSEKPPRRPPRKPPPKNDA
ncbi:unnamed protein product, partial [Symbiodinium sp. KB8]